MSRGWQTFWLTIATLASVVAALPAALGALASPVVFDRPGSLFNPLAWFAFLLIITLWIVCILGPYAAWVSFMRRNSRLAWTFISAPPIWAGVMALALVFLPG